MKNIQSFDEFLNESSAIIVTGPLKFEKYHDDEWYYVDTNELGPLRLTTKFEDSIGDSKLKSLLNKSNKWEVMKWNFSAKTNVEKYKINALSK